MFNCLCLLEVFLITLLSPRKNTNQYWKPRHIKDTRKTIVDRSWVLLTAVRKRCTPNKAEALDTDSDQIIQNLGRWIVLQRKCCFPYEWVRSEHHFQWYYYNERTVVIFTCYKWQAKISAVKMTTFIQILCTKKPQN